MITKITYYYKPQRETCTFTALSSDDFNRFYNIVENSKGNYIILEVKKIQKGSKK